MEEFSVESADLADILWWNTNGTKKFARSEKRHPKVVKASFICSSFHKIERDGVLPLLDVPVCQIQEEVI